MPMNQDALKAMITGMAQKAIESLADDQDTLSTIVENTIYRQCEPFAVVKKEGSNPLESGTYASMMKAMIRAGVNTAQVVYQIGGAGHSEEWYQQASEHLLRTLESFAAEWREREQTAA